MIWRGHWGPGTCQSYTHIVLLLSGSSKVSSSTSVTLAWFQTAESVHTSSFLSPIPMHVVLCTFTPVYKGGNTTVNQIIVCMDVKISEPHHSIPEEEDDNNAWNDDKCK